MLFHACSIFGTYGLTISTDTESGLPETKGTIHERQEQQEDDPDGWRTRRGVATDGLRAQLIPHQDFNALPATPFNALFNALRPAAPSATRFDTAQRIADPGTLRSMTSSTCGLTLRPRREIPASKATARATHCPVEVGLGRMNT
jgi:hypothetical protein